MPEVVSIAVLLVDDQPSLLWGLEQLINGERPRMAVVGKAVDRRSALRMAGNLQPDVILFDLDLGGELSVDFLPELRSRSLARVVVLTGMRDRRLHCRALRAGARSVVLKDAAGEALLDAIASAGGDRRGCQRAKGVNR